MLAHALRVIQALDLEALAVHDQIVAGLMGAVRERNFRALRLQHSGDHPFGDVALQLSDVAEPCRVAERVRLPAYRAKLKTSAEVSDTDEIKRVRDPRVGSHPVVRKSPKVSAAYAGVSGRTAGRVRPSTCPVDRGLQRLGDRKTTKT